MRYYVKLVSLDKNTRGKNCVKKFELRAKDDAGFLKTQRILAKKFSTGNPTRIQTKGATSVIISAGDYKRIEFVKVA